MQIESLSIGRWAAALTLCGAVALCGGPAGAAAAQPATVASALASASMTAGEGQLLDTINDFRRAHGRSPWAAEPALAAAARGHSQAMALRGLFSHDGFAQRAAGTGSTMCIENLLRGKVTPARAVQLWTASPEHREMLLEPGAHHAGIGMVGPFVTLLACASAPADPGRAATPPAGSPRSSDGPPATPR